MSAINNEICWVIIVLIIKSTIGLMNIPSNASWDKYGMTVAGWTNGTNGSSLDQLSRPLGLTITDSDVLYICDRNNYRIVIVDLNSTYSISIIGSGYGAASNQFKRPTDLLVINGALYVTDPDNARIQEMSLNGSNPSEILSATDLYESTYFYIDQNYNIYISFTADHKVVLFTTNSTNFTIVAGIGISGSNLSQLNKPYGIFVDSNGTIYIADCYNNRVMKWFANASTGIIAVGSVPSPTDLTMDTNNYLYISQSASGRITKWASNATSGICIAACTGIPGLNSNQLNTPHSLAFDKYGSLYVGDYANNRIQKFQILHSQNPSYNQPKFSSCTRWDTNAVTFANSSVVGTLPISIFIDTNNTVYVISYSYNYLLIWSEGALSPTLTIPTLSKAYGIFTSSLGDVFIDYGNVSGTVNKWTSSSINSTVVMSIDNICFGMFIDIYNYLYCSIGSSHKVVKKFLNDPSTKSIIVAGTGTSGSTSNELNQPRRIFVTVNLDLYVADSGNNRIQCFRSGLLNATTIPISGGSSNITLQNPTAVVLDADENLFITEYGHHRIIRWDGSNAQCLFGCSGSSGAAADQLTSPRALNFDSYGNLYVVDTDNSRIQKFFLISNSCNDSSTTSLSLTSEEITNTQSTTQFSSDSNVITAYVCDLLLPCENNGNCAEDSNAFYNYVCLCLQNFNGTNCEYDYRPCQPNTCRNNGQCIQTSNQTFTCQCVFGWQGIRCETKINYCSNVTCFNQGVCQPLFLNYSCLCLGAGYSGRYCEIAPGRITALKLFSKSMAYIVIIAIVLLALFMMTLDVLKYCFGIDPTVSKPKEKKPRIAIRFIYVNKISEEINK